MGKKIQCLGRYVMDCQTLGKGSFARVELATHGVTGCKVCTLVTAKECMIISIITKRQRVRKFNGVHSNC